MKSSFTKDGNQAVKAALHYNIQGGPIKTVHFEIPYFCSH